MPGKKNFPFLGPVALCCRVEHVLAHGVELSTLLPTAGRESTLTLSGGDFELRAARSLARLRCDQGRRSDARGLLAPIFCWFTEGFETADLRATKAFLDELT